MIHKIRIDEKEHIRTWSRATSHPFYLHNERAIRELFQRTLEVKNGDYSFLGIQIDLLKAILDADSARRTYQRRKGLIGRALKGLRRAGANEDRVALAQSRFDDMAEGETSAKWVGDRIRAIGDGFAWWVLNYDRAHLRLLAEHQPVSTPQLNRGLVNEVGELLRLVYEEGHPAVLNGVTNYLRVGDITIYDSDSDEIRLVEVKSGKKTTARTRRQGEYLSLVQESLKSGTHSLPGVRMGRLQASRPLQTHVASIERAMLEAEKSFSSSRLFGDYLAVVVLATNKVIDTLPPEDWAGVWERHTGRISRVQRRQNDFVIPRMDNLTAISHFSPNLAPYTVFPIKPRLRFGLLSGEFFVISVLNVSGLARWLRKRGWEVEVNPPSDELEPDEYLTVPVMRVSKGGSGAEVLLPMLTIASMEFWTRESMEESIRVVAERSDSSSTEAAQHWQVIFPNSGKYAWD